MGGDKQCWTCVYGSCSYTGVSCENGFVASLKEKPDPYNCEFYDEITEDYVGDVEKVRDTWDDD